MSKIKLIETIQEKGRFWDALANQYAWDSARDINNEEKRNKAASIVSIADSCRKMSDEIIDLVHIYWPNE